MIAQAAIKHCVDPRSISSKGAVQTLEAFEPASTVPAATRRSGRSRLHIVRPVSPDSFLASRWNLAGFVSKSGNPTAPNSSASGLRFGAGYSFLSVPVLARTSPLFDSIRRCDVTDGHNKLHSIVQARAGGLQMMDVVMSPLIQFANASEHSIANRCCRYG